MAKATKNIIPPKPVEPDFTVTLELTKEEAKIVRDVLHVTGGDPSNTRRRFAHSVLTALTEVLGNRTRYRVSDLKGDLLWFCYPEEKE